MELEHHGIFLSIPENVYPPAEDSFMLADAVQGLSGNILEVGCGCGIVSLSCAKSAEEVVGVDINPDAVECSKQNAIRNNITNAKFTQSNLFSNINGKFDAILFNPPYLPTDKRERMKGDINHAFDGGEDGRKVLDLFLEEFDPYLKPGGTLLLVQSSLNNYEKTASILENKGFSVKVINEKSFFFEKLFIIQATKA